MTAPPRKGLSAPRVRHRKHSRSPGPSLGKVEKLAVVSSYYNPTGCPTMRDNFDVFAENINAPLFMIELAYDGEFVIPDAMRVEGDRDSQLMWQKERLLNLVIESVPDQYDAIAWVDADVLLENPNWVQDTLDMLEHHHVGQIWSYSEEVHGDERYSIRPSCSYAYASGADGHFDLGRYHPGFAWAIRRRSLDAIGGLMEFNVVGNGDTHMCRGWFDEGLWTDKFVSGLWQKANDEWRHRAFSVTQGRIGCVPGMITHLWHGDRTRRKYVDRLSYLGDHDYDPSTDLLIRNKLLTWSPRAIKHKPEMVKKVADYFRERQSDPTCSVSAYTNKPPPKR